MPQTLGRILDAHEPKPCLKETDLMRLMDLLASAFPGEVPEAPDTEPVTLVTADSRQCRPGCVYVAVPGTTVDGARFAPEAVERGAVAVVAERRLDLPERVVQITVPDARAAVADLAAAFYGHPARGMTVVGITGTNGKTSTSVLLRSILGEAGHPTALFGTIRYEVGDRRVPARTTTPDAVTLMAFLREARDLGYRHAVMEVSSHALVQQRTRGIELAVGVFTNLAPEHLEYHRDLAHYRAAKARLFSGLAPGATAVLNAEDPTSNFLSAKTRARVLRYGQKEEAMVRASEIESRMDGIAYFLHLPDARPIRIRSRLLGLVNVWNGLAAAAAAHALGLSPEEIAAGLEACPVVRGRLERVDAGQHFTVLVDYAHSDDALRNVLGNLREVAGSERRIITVMGCGGDRDRTKRPRMGAAAARFSEHVVVTSDNPRSEEPMEIIQDILGGLTGFSNFEVEPDRRRAIRSALRRAGPGDVVLIAGKGHEDYQIISGVVIPFDDREVVIEEIKRMQEGEEGHSPA